MTVVGPTAVIPFLIGAAEEGEGGAPAQQLPLTAKFGSKTSAAHLTANSSRATLVPISTKATLTNG